MTFQISKFTVNKANGLVPLASLNMGKPLPLKRVSCIALLSNFSINNFKNVFSVSGIRVYNTSSVIYLVGKNKVNRYDLIVFKPYFSQTGVIYTLNKFQISLSKTYIPKSLLFINQIGLISNYKSKGNIFVRSSETKSRYVRPNKGQIFPRRRY
jgi:hypothetical protein